MKKIVPILLVAVVLILVGYRVATYGQTEGVKSIGEIQKEAGVPVVVEKAVLNTIEKKLDFNGTVEGSRQSDATAKISEKIVDLKVDIGDLVKAGQVLALLDETSTQIGFAQAKLALEDAERELNRMKSLFEQGAVSRQMLDKVELGYNISKANFKQVSELLEVTAPISGTVTHLFFFEGEAPPPGDPVARIANVKKVRVEISVPRIYWQDLKKSQTAFISISSNPDFKIEGQVERISLSADHESRTFTVHVFADNSNYYLQPGLSADVEIIVSSQDEVITIHRDAIFHESGSAYVFVAEEKARKVQVVTGIESGSMVEIKSGLEAGNKVVVNGQNLLDDGDPLLITE